MNQVTKQKLKIIIKNVGLATMLVLITGGIWSFLTPIVYEPWKSDQAFTAFRFFWVISIVIIITVIYIEIYKHMRKEIKRISA